MKKKFGKVRQKAYMLSTAASLAIMTSPILAFADTTTGGSGDATAKTNAVIDAVITAVLGGLSAVGIFFIFSGVFKVVNAFRNDNNPEAMSAGAKDIVVGAIFLAMGIIWPLIRKALN